MKQRNKKHGEARRRVSVLLAAALLITSVGIPFNTKESKAENTTTGSDYSETFGSAGDAAASSNATPAAVTASSCAVSSPTIDDDGVTTWDCIYFGHYLQDDTNGDTFVDEEDAKEPIKWRVLSVDGDDAFLLADRNLDCQKYNAESVAVTWKTCTLRTWLNETFLQDAFSQEEQAAIKDTEVVNSKNPSYGTTGGENTTDKVYLLSIAEAANTEYGFNGSYNATDKAREAKNTTYAKQHGALTVAAAGYKGNGYWLLRSPGSNTKSAAAMNTNGMIMVTGMGGVTYASVVVRPVLHVNLSASTVWSYAGKVTSEGKVTAQSTAAPATTEQPNVTLNNPDMDDTGVSTWDCVYFGNYWQNDTNGDSFADQDDDQEPIKWRVLSVDGDDAFLLADRNLDCQKYNETGEAATWKSCTLRTWLNETFLQNAFSEEEQAAIKATTVVNDDNSSYGTDGGEDTEDKVYLLSIEESGNTAYGFNGTYNAEAKTREAKNTLYAKGCGALTTTVAGCKGNSYWWLRSPGRFSITTACVGDSGWIRSSGYNVNTAAMAVRPVLHVNLSASTLWSYAGKVTVKEEVLSPSEVPVTPTATPAGEEPAQSMAPTVTPTKTPTGEQPTQSMTPTVTPTETPSEEQPTQSTAPTETPSGEQPAQSMAPTVAPTDTLAATPTGEQSGQSMAPTGTSAVMPNVTPSADDTTKTVAVPSVKLKSFKVTGKSKNKVKVTWKKAEGISGYRLQYAQNKKFRKKLKTKLLDAKKTSVTLKGLKKKKTYYVRIRAYVLSDGKKVYGKWSTVKKIKIKK